MDRPRAAAEWHAARLGLVCEPGPEALLGSVHPEAAGHLRPRALAEGRIEHRTLRQRLEASGVRMVDVREALTAGDPDRLRTAAERALVYRLHPDIEGCDRTRIRELHARTIRGLDPGSLVDLLLLRPTVHVRPGSDGTSPGPPLTGTFTVDPARHVLRPRDLVAVTAAGAVVGRTSACAPSTELLGLVLAQLGVEPILRVREPGILDGGDVLPAGQFVLQGQGSCSDADGIGQLLDAGAYGDVEVGVVLSGPGRDPEARLDSYLALYGPGLAGICEDRLGSAQPEVDVHVPEPTMAGRRYRRVRTVALLEYLLSKRMHVLVFSIEEREGGAAEGLLVRPMHALVPGSAGAPFRTRLREHGVTAEPVSLDALEAAAGGPRRSVQVLLREPSALA